MHVLAWWRSRSRAARIDLYVRASCYFNFAAFPFLIPVGLAPEVGTAATWALTLLTTL
jgi:two-component system sensor histidine kinase DesK